MITEHHDRGSVHPWTAAALLTVLTVTGLGAAGPAVGPRPPGLHLQPAPDDLEQLYCQFSPSQLALLEKLNRCDRTHLVRLGEIVVPDRWELEEIAYSPLPERFDIAGGFPKIIVIHQPGQVFGAYESGNLVRWGPISSGSEQSPTPAGVFYLNWRSPGHRSTVNRNWFLPWYFNFHNKRGHSFHQYELPGHPASHGCVRLLERDARWLFDWGEAWRLGPKGWSIERHGTPVLILGDYDFGKPAPWRSLEYLAMSGQLSLEAENLPQAALLLAAATLAGDDEQETQPSVQRTDSFLR